MFHVKLISWESSLFHVNQRISEVIDVSRESLADAERGKDRVE